MQKADGEMTLNRIHMRESAAAGKHYNCIDLTKFICAVLVILIHVPLFVNFKDYSNPLLNYGAYILEYGPGKGIYSKASAVICDLDGDLSAVNGPEWISRRE